MKIPKEWNMTYDIKAYIRNYGLIKGIYWYVKHKHGR